MMGALFRHCSALLALVVLTALVQLTLVCAQSTPAPASSNSSASSSTASPTVTTSNFTSTITSTSASRTSLITSVIQTTITLSPSPTSGNATATNSISTSSSSASATPFALDTKIDPGFGVLGAILIITGLPSTFWGHKNRWSSFFLIGFYTFALACVALILKFGVLEAVNPPSETIRGIFVLACCIAGIAGGGVAIFFWQQAKYLIGGWGGFAIGLWVQCFRDGGLIRPIGYRWILYIGLGVIGFCLCTFPKIHYHMLLASTAAVGASAFILGIDCFTTAGLKEFYIWNLGFDALFPIFTNNGIEFPISQMMEIELGLIGAFTLMGAAVQLRVLKILQYKLKEISRDQKRRDEELEAQAAARFTMTAEEMAIWEKEHGRADSHLSGLPLLKDQEAQSPNTEEASTLVLGEHRRSRYQSGISEFMAAPQNDERQQSGALPAIDLGHDLESDIPKDFVMDSLSPSTEARGLTLQEREDLKRKEMLMSEISNIRKSIEHLRASTPGSSAEGDARSRHQSFTSRRTLSLGFVEALEAPSRPPRAMDPRARVQSMDILSQSPGVLTAGSAISRPSSAPLQEDVSWNDYVRERKLFQPPAGVSAPIAAAPIAPQPKRPTIAVPDSVSEALMRRHRQEAAIETGEFNIMGRHDRSGSYTSSEERPLSRTLGQQQKLASKAPVAILPPRKPDPAQQSVRPSAPRTRTFEELAERHREKLHDLQAPLSEAEREQATLAAARNRWERSKEVERQVMVKKEAEKAAAAKQRQEEGDKRPSAKPEHRRSLSADKLGKLPGASGPTSKRQSMLKVEDWRRYQQDTGTAGPAQPPSGRDPAVPFPGQAGREPGHHNSVPSKDRRRSQLLPPPS